MSVELIFSAIIPVILTFLSYIGKQYVDLRKFTSENKEIDNEVTKVIHYIDKGDTDVLALMMKNVAELREYYVINKQQARNSFSAAVFVSSLGFAVFIAGISYSFYVKETDIIPYSTAGGAIIEIISGLFFWLYKKAISQINLFHSSLLKTEKFLTAIQLVDKISTENRDKTYEFIIAKIISDGALSEIRDSA